MFPQKYKETTFAAVGSFSPITSTVHHGQCCVDNCISLVIVWYIIDDACKITTLGEINLDKVNC